MITLSCDLCVCFQRCYHNFCIETATSRLTINVVKKHSIPLTVFTLFDSLTFHFTVAVRQ